MDANYIRKLLHCFAQIMQENREFLIEQDSIVGDGDLGLTMSDGFQAAAEYACKSDEADVGKLLYMAGKAISVAVPSTMGTLMASGFMQAGKALKGVYELDLKHITALFQAYEEGVMHRGKAKVHEKTFLDGIDPAVQSMRSSLETEEDMESFAQKAYEAACAGYENTATMLAVHGRAATRGEMSRTLKDPGACVAMLMMKAFMNSVASSL